MHEQVEAISEANRWAAYLKTSPRLPVINHKMPVRNLKEERPRNLKEERPKVVNPKPETQKADQHEFWCHECGEGGSLLCCDHCVLVWHVECLHPAAAKIPKGKWACPVCVAAKPSKPKQHPGSTKPAKRKRGPSMLDMVPSDLTFEAQMEMALRQSKLEEERRRRRARLAGTAATSAISRPCATPAKKKGSSRNEAHRGFPPAGDALSDDTLAMDECVLGDFIIQAATEKVELEGFNICASEAR